MEMYLQILHCHELGRKIRTIQKLGKLRLQSGINGSVTFLEWVDDIIIVCK